MSTLARFILVAVFFGLIISCFAYLGFRDHVDKILFMLLGGVSGQLIEWMFEKPSGPTKVEKEEIIKTSTPRVIAAVPQPDYERLRLRWNDLARRWNALVKKHTELSMAHKAFASEAIEHREWRLVARSILRTSVCFSLLCIAITYYIPPRPQSLQGSELSESPGSLINDERIAALKHIGALGSGALIVSLFVGVYLYLKTNLYVRTIAWRIGLIGIAASGVIALSVSLPYQWKEFSSRASPIEGLNLAHYIVLVRIAVLPLLSFLGVLVILTLFPGGRVRTTPQPQ